MTVLPKLELPFRQDSQPPRFPIGQLLITPAALDCLEQAGVSVFDLLARHVAGDWGDVCAEDAQLNDDALRFGNRLLSVYHVAGVKLFCISEADRSATTLLLSEQY